MMFRKVCISFGIPEPAIEYKFHKDRKWRFDYAWPMHKVALEVEGGAWTRGRHTRGKGFIEDMNKYNSATSEGWRILRIAPSDLLKISTLDLIKKTINQNK